MAILNGSIDKIMISERDRMAKFLKENLSNNMKLDKFRNEVENGKR